MFDEDDDLFDGRDLRSPPPEQGRPVVRDILALVEELDHQDILLLIQLLNGLVPAPDLKQLDMEAELAMQYRDLKALQARILIDPYVAPNHKSQIAGQVTNALQKITQLQTKVHDSEQVKLIEQALVLTLQAQPNAQALLHTYSGHLDRLTRSKKS